MVMGPRAQTTPAEEQVQLWPTPHLRNMQRLGYHVESHRMDRGTSLHRQPGIEVTVLVEGAASMHVADQQIPLAPGRAVVFRADQPHKLRLESERAHRMALCLNVTQLAPLRDPRGRPLFDLSWVPEAGALPAKLTPAWIEQLTQATTTLIEETLHPQPDGGAYRLAVLMQLWAGLHRFALAQGDLSGLTENGLARVSEIVDEARRYVRRHLTEDLSLDRVSEQVDVSREYLTRCFKTETGIPFHQYVIRQRLLRARRLLSETDRPVTAVCMDAGFGSLSHFIRTFKKAFGQTPSVYRRGATRGM